MAAAFPPINCSTFSTRVFKSAKAAFRRATGVCSRRGNTSRNRAATSAFKVWRGREQSYVLHCLSRHELDPCVGVRVGNFAGVSGTAPPGAVRIQRCRTRGGGGG